MAPLPKPTLVAVATGIVGSAWSAGAIAGISLFGVPAAKAVPSSSAQVWSVLYHRGATLMPALGAVTASIFAYAAYDTRRIGLIEGPASAKMTAWYGLAAAGVAAVLIAPYTIVVMIKTNSALKAAASGASAMSPTQVHQLIDKWAVMNLVRSLFPLAGAVTGLVSLLRASA